MRRLFVFAMFAFFINSAFAAVDTEEKEAVLKTVEDAYAIGIHIDRNPQAIRKGFHQEFVMFINGDEGVRKVTRDEWIARIEEGNKKNPDRPKPDVKYDLELLDMAKDAAVVKVDLHRDGKHVFTDYMSLYKFEDGWKIVGKIFHSHR